MLLWAESLRKQKSTFFFAWNSSDCFESFSPSILSTTEGVKTTRSNRMKFRLRSSPLPLSSRLFYFFCEKRVLVLPKDAHRPFIFSLPHYSPLRFWSILNPPLFYFLTRLVISQEKISGSGKGYRGGLQPTKNPTATMTVFTKRADSLLKTLNLAWNVYTSVSKEEDLIATNP